MIKGVIAGNFDVLHPGYVDMFKEMRQHCDVLVVLLHEDPTLERPNKLKPVLSVAERVFMLEDLKLADDVITYKYEAVLYDLLKIGQFDIKLLSVIFNQHSLQIKASQHVFRRFIGMASTSSKHI